MSSHPQIKHLAILGSTGSIGQSTLSIAASYLQRYSISTLAAGTNVEEIFAQCCRWKPKCVSLANETAAGQLKRKLREADLPDIEVLYGTAGTIAVATHPEVDFVISAIVGVAGLEATYAAIVSGKTIGVANKECLVAAGEILIAEAARRNVALLPIDSEHNAVHQCMRGGARQEVRKIWLTASGGPFRNLPKEQFAGITPAQALKHPTWVMGRRITVDSATMMNKGFEVIEACRLFNIAPSAVGVLIHPQSTIHSMVEFVDGSLLAQISVTDMRLPILYALSYPERVPSELTFDIGSLRQLDFSPPDFDRFPCLRLAYEAAEAGGSKCIALNAADEVAVAAFLEGKLPFPAIAGTIEEVLRQIPQTHPGTIEQVLELDREARTITADVVSLQAIAQRG